MKRLTLLMTALLLALAAPVTPARAEVAVSIDFFYDALSPHGDWIYADDYGYVWQPAVAQEPDWAPYTDGYWAYTDGGWTWMSNEDFGWATYHYGRWIRMQGNWVWVPGYEWAPAWVSWRQSDDHIGWAPLPPEASWSGNVGFNQWTDSYYDIGPSWYNFVPLNVFSRRTSLRPIIVDRSRNVTYVDRSVNITNISYRQNVVNNIFVGGPDPDRLDRVGGERVRRLRLRQDEDRFRRDYLDNRGERPRGFEGLSRIDRDDLFVAAPSIRREESNILPSRVRERFERPEVDRGWRNIGDRDLAERVRDRQREELSKARPENLPEKKPIFATSRLLPPALGRVLNPEERRSGLKRPEPRRVDEDVRKAIPGSRPGDEPPAGDPRRPGMDRDDRPGLPGREDRPGTPEGERRPGMPGREDRPGLPGRDSDRPGIPDGERRPGMPDRDRDARPGLPGRDANRPGTPMPEGERRPGLPGRDDRSGMPERDGRPGLPGRDAERPGAPNSERKPRLPGRDDRSGMTDRGDRPSLPGTPGTRNDTPDAKPGETVKPRPTPGGVPGDAERRRGGAPKPNDPVPSPEADRSQPNRPQARPEMPKGPQVRPDGSKERPDGRGNRGPGTSRSPENTRPVPMPEARPNARPAPMPRPETPKVKPAPMPAPKPRIAPERPAPSRPEAAERKAPPISRPTPQVRSPAPKAERPAPAAQVKRPAPQPKPQARPAPEKRPAATAAKGGAEKRKRDD